MTREEVINQLKILQKESEEFVNEKYFSESKPFLMNIEALAYAIQAIEQTTTMGNSKFYKGFEYYKKGNKYIVRIGGEYVGEYKTVKEIKERIDNQTI